MQRARLAHIDNDYFVFSRPPNQRSDDNYTHGALLQVTFGAAPTRATRRLCPARAACALTLSLGHAMYTPTEEDTVPLPGHRPHAGWLSGGATLRAVTRDRAAGLGLVVGTTGPASRADDLQVWIHRIDPFLPQPVGWEHQLRNEIAFAATARLEQMGLVGDRQRWGADVSPYAALTAGTLRVSAESGVALRVGWGLRHPWVRETPSIYGLYAIVRMGGELVGHDLFLDGNTRGPSVRVPRRPAVTEFERGMGMRMLKLLVEYSVTSRSQDYVGGPGIHRYGRVRASWLP